MAEENASRDLSQTVGTPLEQPTEAPLTIPAAKRTITLQVTVGFRDMTADELSLCGLDEICEPGQEVEDCAPDCFDFSAHEFAAMVASTLRNDEVQDEMFAGTGIFARIMDVQAKASPQ